MLYRILIFTYMFHSLLRPSSVCFTRILIKYNSCPNYINKTTYWYIEYIKRFLVIK